MYRKYQKEDLYASIDTQSLRWLTHMPNLNRLQLDFSIPTKTERNRFIHDYLSKLPFTPTEDELEMMGKYILWGIDEKTGLNGRQEGLELETKHKTWDSKNIESLDALIETPGFSETLIKGPHDPPLRPARETFSRSLARKNAPPHILAALEALWIQIDRTELLCTLYELDHKKRTKPVRDELLKRFNAPDLDTLKLEAKSLKPYNYLKLKHELVELRREQYTYRDMYAEPLQPQSTFNARDHIAPTFEADFSIQPVQLPDNGDLARKLWRKDRYPEPNDFNDTELEAISRLLWTQPAPSKRYFDFRDTDHLYALFGMWDELNEPSTSLYSTLDRFLNALDTYKCLANLSPLLEKILELKVKKKTNQDIAELINKEFGKNYRSNYISTLYCKKCLAMIAAAASKHREVLENLCFPENFKKCKDCGRVLLLNSENFVKRSRSNDGFSPRCKCCEKKNRENKEKK